MRVILDLDRMRAYNLSLNDLVNATAETRMIGSPEQERLRQANGQSQTLEYVLGSYVLGWGTRYSKPEQFGNIILRASPEGEILRLKDVATVRLGGSSFLIPGGGAGTTQNIVRIGHSLFALIVGWLGGALSRKFRPSH
jgi:hydrophobic/amphiphilic exporter-1 (mainly G- bacteria), HAE1 family